MRHNAKRSSKGARSSGKKNNKMKVYDSNGPDVRLRGTAYQITEKYETLARDAERAGNHILAQNYRQHFEHYQRIINSFEEETVAKNNEKKTSPVENQDQSQGEESLESLDLPASMIAEAPVAEGELATA